MPIKGTKKSKSKKIEEESSFDRVSREMDEEHTKKVKRTEEKVIIDSLERERRHKLFKLYLDKLETQLKEKGMLSFWTFADRKGFKKFSGSDKKIDKMLKGDINKYRNRQLAEYIIQFHHNEKENSIFNIDDEGLRIGKNKFYECSITWKDADFGISKFSLKLIEKFLKPLADNKINCSSIFGLTLRFVIDHYKEKVGMDFSDVLQPLKDY
jgi:hypothetical protein